MTAHRCPRHGEPLGVLTSVCVRCLLQEVAVGRGLACWLSDSPHLESCRQFTPPPTLVRDGDQLQLFEQAPAEGPEL